jgi:hypothetical protein
LRFVCTYTNDPENKNMTHHQPVIAGIGRSFANFYIYLLLYTTPFVYKTYLRIKLKTGNLQFCYSKLLRAAPAKVASSVTKVGAKLRVTHPKIDGCLKVLNAECGFHLRFTDRCY